MPIQIYHRGPTIRLHGSMKISTIAANAQFAICWIAICLVVCNIGQSAWGSESAMALAAEVKQILRSRCAECHSAEASSTDFDILSVESLMKADVVKAGKPDESKLMDVIVSEDEEIRMPKDLPAMSPSEIDKIRRWIAEGAAAFPMDVVMPTESHLEKAFDAVTGVEYVLTQILTHQRSLPSSQQRFVRYFSCNHLLTRGATRDELNIQRDALAKTLNHLTYERDPVMIAAIDGETASVFAVDLRKLGWHRDALQAADKNGRLKSSLNAYDLLLLEYPEAPGQAPRGEFMSNAPSDRITSPLLFSCWRTHI